MRSCVLAMLALTACGGSVSLPEGDTDGYDATDHKDNEPPGAPEVSLKPLGPDTLDDLEATIVFDAEDPDGDRLTYEFAWLVDGDPRTDLTESTVSASETTKGENWEVRVRAFDGRERGPAAEDSVDIDNAAPELTLTWEDASPTTDQDLVVLSTKDDPDGDVVTLDYTWTVDGGTTPFVTDTVPADATTRGELWSVEVVGTDEDDASDAKTLDVTIVNRSPVIAGLSVTPNPASPSDNLTVVGTVTDPDGDTVQTTYAWTVNGTPSLVIAPTIPAALTENGQTWTVTVVADDLNGGVTTANASAQVVNHDPEITGLSISPNPAAPSATLTVNVTVTDPDNDTVLTTYAWTVDNVPSSVITPSVPAAYTEDGQTWRVTVTADDQNGGVVSASASAQIVNHAPTASSAEIWPAPPGDDDTLYAFINDADDVDNDPLTYSYRWTRNGSTYPSTSSYIDSSVTTIGDTWQVTISVSDGSTTVAFASPVETIQDLLPTAPVVVFVPDTPNTCNPLVCSVTEDSYDPDGTLVNYTVTWQKNGAAYTGTRTTSVLTNDTVPTAALVPGDVWTCSVTPSSNGKNGPAGVVASTVQDQSPTDVFTTTVRTQADILLMIDDSCSMSPYQSLFTTASGVLVDELDSLGVDYHIAVVTSDMDDAAASGAMIVNAAGSVNATSAMPDRKVVLADMVTRGINGSPYEMGLATTYAALRPPLSTGANAAFFRNAGALGVLFLTDEDDQSTTPSPADYTAFLRTKRPASDLVLWGIIGDKVDGCSGTFGSAYAGTLYARAIEGLDGTWSSICDSTYDASARDFADAIAGLPRRFQLSQAPSPSSLAVVKVAPGGTRTTLVSGVGYTFDAASSSVLLSARPTSGTSFEISYSVVCAAP